MSDSELTALIEEGERLIHSKLYDRAMVELNKALNLDSEQTNLALLRIFDVLQSSNEYDSIIAIGSNMLIHKPENTSLANVLGNSYRRIGNIHQAEKLYEHCLKYDPHHTFASYNLAATKAHADLYNSNAVNAARSFEDMTWFKLPQKDESIKRLQPFHDQAKQAALQNEDMEEENNALPEYNLDTTDIDFNFSNKSDNATSQIINAKQVFQWLRKNRDMHDPETLAILRDLAIYSLHEKHTEVAWRSLAYLKYNYPQDQELESFWALSYFLRNLSYVCEDKLVRLLGQNTYHRYANVNLGFLYKTQNKTLLSRKYFILTHTLLEKSMGYYEIDDFIALGERYQNQNSYANAVKVFEVIYHEIPIWKYARTLGELYLHTHNFEKAISTFHEMMDMENPPENFEEEWHAINVNVLETADKLLHDQKLRRAAELFELSTEIEFSKEILEKALQTYHTIHDKNNIDRLYKQLEAIELREKAKEQENIRQEKIQQAEKMIKENQFYPAITLLESILQMKADTHVLEQLTMLYKRTKQTDLIKDAQKRFEKVLEQSKTYDEMV